MHSDIGLKLLICWAVIAVSSLCVSAKTTARAGKNRTSKRRPTKKTTPLSTVNTSLSLCEALQPCLHFGTCVNFKKSYHCICHKGYDPWNDCRECAAGKFGERCSLECVGCHLKLPVCDRVIGCAKCGKGWLNPPACNQITCNNSPCMNGATCSRIQNRCRCAPGWTGVYCQTYIGTKHLLPCPNTSHGAEPVDSCSNGGSCFFTGRYQPLTRARQALCLCPEGFSGSHCQYACKENSHNCLHGKCVPGVPADVNKSPIYKPSIQKCEECHGGWQGRYCSEPCVEGRWGLQCEFSCGQCKIVPCDFEDGLCELSLCLKGWLGRRCDVRDDSEDESDTEESVGIVALSRVTMKLRSGLISVWEKLNNTLSKEYKELEQEVYSYYNQNFKIGNLDAEVSEVSLELEDSGDDSLDQTSNSGDDSDQTSNSDDDSDKTLINESEEELLRRRQRDDIMKLTVRRHRRRQLRQVRRRAVIVNSLIEIQTEKQASRDFNAELFSILRQNADTFHSSAGFRIDVNSIQVDSTVEPASAKASSTEFLVVLLLICVPTVAIVLWLVLFGIYVKKHKRKMKIPVRLTGFNSGHTSGYTTGPTSGHTIGPTSGHTIGPTSRHTIRSLDVHNDQFRGQGHGLPSSRAQAVRFKQHQPQPQMTR